MTSNFRTSPNPPRRQRGDLGIPTEAQTLLSRCLLYALDRQYTTDQGLLFDTCRTLTREAETIGDSESAQEIAAKLRAAVQWAERHPERAGDLARWAWETAGYYNLCRVEVAR